MSKEIRNIWAVGRNYADHAKELGHAAPAADSAPMIFLKAGSGIVADGGTAHLPPFSKDVHHEVEVAFQFGSDLKFAAISIAIDLTARDIQTELKAKSHPWSLAKSFKDSTFLGPLVKLPSALKTDELEFTLKINGSLKQTGHMRDMIHPLEKIRAYVVERFPVVAGDLLLTGTPVGVGPLKAGDQLEAEIKGLIKATWRIAT